MVFTRKNGRFSMAMLVYRKVISWSIYSAGEKKRLELSGERWEKGLVAWWWGWFDVHKRPTGTGNGECMAMMDHLSKKIGFIYFEDDKKVVHIQMSLDFNGFFEVHEFWEFGPTWYASTCFFWCLVKVSGVPFRLALPVGFRIPKNEAIKYSLHTK